VLIDENVVTSAGLSEDADIDDMVRVFEATLRSTPSDIVYHLEFHVIISVLLC